MSENDTRATVDELFGAYRGHDVERFAALLHDDIDWVIYGPIYVFPFAGLRRGRAAVLQAVANISQLYTLENHTPEVVIVEGDCAAVMADVGFRQIASGRVIRFRVANFLRIEYGRLIEFREFADSFDQVEQAIGHTVDI